MSNMYCNQSVQIRLAHRLYTVVQYKKNEVTLPQCALLNPILENLSRFEHFISCKFQTFLENCWLLLASSRVQPKLITSCGAAANRAVTHEKLSEPSAVNSE